MFHVATLNLCLYCLYVLMFHQLTLSYVSYMYFMFMNAFQVPLQGALLLLIIDTNIFLRPMVFYTIQTACTNRQIVHCKIH